MNVDVCVSNSSREIFIRRSTSRVGEEERRKRIWDRKSRNTAENMRTLETFERRREKIDRERGEKSRSEEEKERK